MVAPHEVGLNEHYGTELAIAALVTKIASFGLDALVPVVSPSSPSLVPEPDLKPPGHDPDTWEWGTPSRQKRAQRGEGSSGTPMVGNGDITHRTNIMTRAIGITTHTKIQTVHGKTFLIHSSELYPPAFVMFSSKWKRTPNGLYGNIAVQIRGLTADRPEGIATSEKD
jgi:hypothetical protein